MVMKEKTPFDFERFKEETMQDLYNGKSLSPNDGVLAPLMKHLLESMMDGELENHIQEEKASGSSNRRNGKTKKTFLTMVGVIWSYSTCSFKKMPFKVSFYPIDSRI